MTSVPSESISYLSMAYFDSSIGKRKPAYHEWLRAKCGAMSDNEKRDLETVKDARVFEEIKEWSQTHAMDDDNRRHLAYFKNGWLQAQKLSATYRAYLLKEDERRTNCEERSVGQEAELRWRRELLARRRVVRDQVPDFLNQPN